MTDCGTQLVFPDSVPVPVVVDFEGGNRAIDAGTLLPRQVDERLGLTAGLAACLVDLRDPPRVEHLRIEQVPQRVYQIAMGYEIGLITNETLKSLHAPLLVAAEARYCANANQGAPAGRGRLPGGPLGRASAPPPHPQ